MLESSNRSKDFLMLYQFQQLRTLMAYKNSQQLGDFALLKADLLGVKAHPAI